ncbi:MAG: biotin/lipoyl-binding protein, partial [Muribaculaceae bacterium]|nr:biotin/lipoyl-binding protein [Muribaculaceae bacterium]
VAQLKQLQASDLLDDAMRLIPKVRRDAGLIPLVTPTSQIVGSQAVSLALDRKKGKPDYSTPSMQFTSLVKGEYGHTPVPVDPEFRRQITGSPEEVAYDTSKYRAPENPELPELGGVKLAQNKEEELLLELLPAVATGFLRKRRTEEFQARQQAEAEAAAAAEAARKAAEPEIEEEPITGEVVQAPMGGTIITVDVKVGDKVKAGDKLLVYEAMKMENEVEAEHDATVKRIFVEPGQVVGLEANLIEFE